MIIKIKNNKSFLLFYIFRNEINNMLFIKSFIKLHLFNLKFYNFINE